MSTSGYGGKNPLDPTILMALLRTLNLQCGVLGWKWWMCVDDVPASGTNPSLLGEQRPSHLFNNLPLNIPKKGRVASREAKERRGREGRGGEIESSRSEGRHHRISAWLHCSLIDRPAEGPGSQTHRCADWESLYKAQLQRFSGCLSPHHQHPPLFRFSTCKLTWINYSFVLSG